MEGNAINLKVLLPSRVFLAKTDVKRIVAHGIDGSFGILPHRLDGVAALSPGVLTYQLEGQDESYLAIDQGTLVKAGLDVLVSVRDAVSGTSLGELHERVKQSFLALDEQKKSMRTVLAKMESGFVRRFMEFQHE